MGGGGPCDYCVSPSPFNLDFGTSDSGLTIKKEDITRASNPERELWASGQFGGGGYLGSRKADFGGGKCFKFSSLLTVGQSNTATLLLL